MDTFSVVKSISSPLFLVIHDPVGDTRLQPPHQCIHQDTLKDDEKHDLNNCIKTNFNRAVFRVPLARYFCFVSHFDSTLII